MPKGGHSVAPPPRPPGNARRSPAPWEGAAAARATCEDDADQDTGFSRPGRRLIRPARSRFRSRLPAFAHRDIAAFIAHKPDFVPVDLDDRPCSRGGVSVIDHLALQGLERTKSGPEIDPGSSMGINH